MTAQRLASPSIRLKYANVSGHLTAEAAAAVIGVRRRNIVGMLCILCFYFHFLISFSLSQ
jgi:hypothetical protein